MSRVALSFLLGVNGLAVACGSLTGADELSVGVGEAKSRTASDTPKDDEEKAAPTPSTTATTTAPTSSAPRDAGPVPSDAAAEADAPPPRVEQTFTVAAGDCGGGRCGGGYDGAKDFAGAKNTADKQCQDRGFARALDITIGGQPGGRFCSWNPNAKVYGCDPDCSGCNVMATVTCEKP